MKGLLRPASVAALLLAGCAYYNGLYNAEDLAHRAEHAEKQGRAFEAKSLWAQAAVKAETVLVHHPRSRWTEEARWLDGKALERSGNCRAALAPLQATLDAHDARRADDAALRLAACQVALGDAGAAGFAVERLVNSPDPHIRAEARWRTGATYRRVGRGPEAVTLLRGSRHPRARGELAAALADVGDVSGALALADSLLAEPDTLAPWGAIFASIASRDRPAASALIDRARPALHPSIDSAQAWLDADAERWLPVDTGRAYARLREVRAAGPERVAGFGALLVLLRHRLSLSDDPRILDTVRTELADIPPTAGEATFEGQTLLRLAELAATRLDSIAPDDGQGDLRGFLLGELLRDSLQAPGLAIGVWRRVVQDHPASPYTPKVLLALAAADRAPPDSILAVLRASYPTSPYLLAYLGAEDPGYRVLEDSLYRFGMRQRNTVPHARPRTNVPRVRPDSTRARGVIEQ